MQLSFSCVFSWNNHWMDNVHGSLEIRRNKKWLSRSFDAYKIAQKEPMYFLVLLMSFPVKANTDICATLHKCTIIPNVRLYRGVTLPWRYSANKPRLLISICVGLLALQICFTAWNTSTWMDIFFVVERWLAVCFAMHAMAYWQDSVMCQLSGCDCICLCACFSLFEIDWIYLGRIIDGIFFIQRSQTVDNVECVCIHQILFKRQC